MFITIIGVNVFSGNPIIEVTQKINIYGSFSSCEQCFRSGIAIDLSGMRQYRPLSGRTQKDVIAEPTDKWRDGERNSPVLQMIRSVQLPALFRF